MSETRKSRLLFKQPVNGEREDAHKYGECAGTETHAKRKGDYDSGVGAYNRCSRSLACCEIVMYAPPVSSVNPGGAEG